MPNQDFLYKIALTLVKGIGNIRARQVIDNLGDPAILFKEKARLLELIPGISARIVSEIRKPEVLIRAEKELDFIEKNKIQALFISDEAYPSRLRECVDAPVVLYYRGNSSLNAPKIISVVGTRHATAYGKHLVREMIRDFAAYDSEILVVSGLAYGVDILAHQAALDEGLSTVAVVAHGLDRIYPAEHRNIAVKMLEQGGLISDFVSETSPERSNFVKRNRIIAGIADCTIVVESASKGGALITANIADSYGRDVFAFPGNTKDKYSMGCNLLIKERKAALVESAEDILREMRWITEKKAPIPIQKGLMLDVSPEEMMIVDILAKTGSMQINLLAIELNTPISHLASLLFGLEMKGLVRCMPGGLYKLL